VCVCVGVCATLTCRYIHTQTHTFVFLYVHVHVCVCVCVWLCVCVIRTTGSLHSPICPTLGRQNNVHISMYAYARKQISTRSSACACEYIIYTSMCVIRIPAFSRPICPTGTQGKKSHYSRKVAVVLKYFYFRNFFYVPKKSENNTPQQHYTRNISST
jgi:hypothetical protein